MCGSITTCFADVGTSVRRLIQAGRGIGRHRLWVRVDLAHRALVDGLADGACRIAHRGGKQRLILIYLCYNICFGLIAAYTRPRGEHRPTGTDKIEHSLVSCKTYLGQYTHISSHHHGQVAE